MTRTEYLLTQLGEECAEVIQAASKIQRFGFESKSPYNGKTNRENLTQEIIDIMGIVDMLVNEDILVAFNEDRIIEAIKKKKEKVNKYIGALV